MKTKIKLAVALLFVVALASLGALSDPTVSVFHDELQNREYTSRNYSEWFGGNSLYGGVGNPVAQAYFLGRADAYREARVLLDRLDDTGSLIVPISAK